MRQVTGPVGCYLSHLFCATAHERTPAFSRHRSAAYFLRSPPPSPQLSAAHAPYCPRLATNGRPRLGSPTRLLNPSESDLDTPSVFSALSDQV
jgi:hypothetical protein